MDAALFLTGLSCRHYGDIVVDNTEGGVAFDRDKLSYRGLPAKLVVVDVEGGSFRYLLNGGAPTATSGVQRMDGDQFMVPGQDAITNFRAIRIKTENSTLRYHVYF